MMQDLTDIERRLRLALAARQRLCADRDAIMDALPAPKPTGATAAGRVRADLPPLVVQKLAKIDRALARTERTIAGLRQQAVRNLNMKDYRYVS